MTDRPQLSTQHLCRDFAVGRTTVKALCDVSLDIRAGEFIAVLGPSGSGKSTLMHLLGLLDTPTRGKVHFEGIDATQLSIAKRAALRNLQIGFVFQAYHLLPQATALDNVALPLLYSGQSSMSRRTAAGSALERVGLADRLRHRPSMLSGGEQQRVALARALVNNPALLIADEPTGALDSESGASILRLLASLNADGRSIVMVTHDASVAACARRRVDMRDGRITSDTATPHHPVTIDATEVRPIRRSRTASELMRIGLWQRPDIDLSAASDQPVSGASA